MNEADKISVGSICEQIQNSTSVVTAWTIIVGAAYDFSHDRSFEYAFDDAKLFLIKKQRNEISLFGTRGFRMRKSFSSIFLQIKFYLFIFLISTILFLFLIIHEVSIVWGTLEYMGFSDWVSLCLQKSKNSRRILSREFLLKLFPRRFYFCFAQATEFQRVFSITKQMYDKKPKIISTWTKS